MKFFSIAPLNVSGAIDDVDMPELVYSDWRKRGKILQKLAPIKESFLIFRKIKRNSNVWFYNISILNIVFIFPVQMVQTFSTLQCDNIGYLYSEKKVVA